MISVLLLDGEHLGPGTVMNLKRLASNFVPVTKVCDLILFFVPPRLPPRNCTALAQITTAKNANLRRPVISTCWNRYANVLKSDSGCEITLTLNLI